jgi:hypothetical protein
MTLSAALAESFTSFTASRHCVYRRLVENE